MSDRNIPSKVVSEDAAFEAWWDVANRASFALAYGSDEPYRSNWGSGYKMTSRVAWMARAAQPETKAPHELSTVELLNERDRIQGEIARRVLGDPRESVSLGSASFDFVRIACANCGKTKERHPNTKCQTWAGASAQKTPCFDPRTGIEKAPQ